MTEWMIWLLLAVLILLALAVLILRTKVGVRVVFGKECRIWLKAGPRMVLLYPREEQKDEKAQVRRAKKKEKKKKAEKEKRQITFDAVWELISALLPLGLDAMERVRRGLHIRRFSLLLTISDRDPAETARRYGKVNAILWPLLTAVENVVTVEQRDVRVTMNYTQWRTGAEGEIFFTLRLWHGALILLTDGRKAVRPLLRFLKQTKPVKDRGKKAKGKKPSPQTGQDAA